MLGAAERAQSRGPSTAIPASPTTTQGQGRTAMWHALGQAVQPIRYRAYRARGSKWNIEHALVGEDYVYQLFPLRPMRIDWKSVIAQFIAAMDAIFPRSVEIKYTPPSERFELKYFTIRVEGVARLPGWENAVEGRALPALSAVDAWPLAAAGER